MKATPLTPTMFWVLHNVCADVPGFILITGERERTLERIQEICSARSCGDDAYELSADDLMLLATWCAIMARHNADEGCDDVLADTQRAVGNMCRAIAATLAA